MKTKRILAFLLASLCLSFVSCSTEGNGNVKATDTKTVATEETGETVTIGTEDSEIKSMAETVKKFYAEDTKLVYKADDDADDNYEFVFTYYFEDEKFISAVEDYVLTVGEGVDTFAMITFKEGTDKALVDEAVAVLTDVYAENLKNTYAPYDPASAKATEEYMVKTDGNTIVFVISVNSMDDIIGAIG